MCKVRDRDNKPRELGLAVGGRVRFGETLAQHGIRNGTHAVLDALIVRAWGQRALRGLAIDVARPRGVVSLMVVENRGP